MTQQGQLAKQQILEEYDRAIARLEAPQSGRGTDTCKRHSDVAEGVLLMMRFHRLQLRESLGDSGLRRQVHDGLKVALIATAVAAAMSRDAWALLGDLASYLTR